MDKEARSFLLLQESYENNRDWQGARGTRRYYRMVRLERLGSINTNTGSELCLEQDFYFSFS